MCLWPRVFVFLVFSSSINQMKYFIPHIISIGVYVCFFFYFVFHDGISDSFGSIHITYSAILCILHSILVLKNYLNKGYESEFFKQSSRLVTISLLLLFFGVSGVLSNPGWDGMIYLLFVILSFLFLFSSFFFLSFSRRRQNVLFLTLRAEMSSPTSEFYFSNRGLANFAGEFGSTVNKQVRDEATLGAVTANVVFGRGPFFTNR